MSTISTDDLASSLAAQFDDGAWVLVQNQHALEQTAKLAQEASALILTFRSHRFRPIAGADDLTDESEWIRRGLGAFAKFGIDCEDLGWAESRGRVRHVRHKHRH